MTHPVFGVLGSADVAPALIADSLTDWLESLQPSSQPPTAWFPASRAATTAGLRAVFAWAATTTDIDLDLRAVAAPTPGVRGREIIADCTDTIKAASPDEVIPTLLQQLEPADGMDSYLILLWEEGTDDDDMERIARDAAALGIKIKALSSTGLDDIEIDMEEEEEGVPNESAAQDAPPVTSAFTGPGESTVDEAQAVIAPSHEHQVGEHMADLATALFKIILEIARQVVKEEITKSTVPAQGRARGAEGMITVVKLADGTYRRLTAGRLPAGATKIQISLAEAQALGLAA